MKIKASCPTDGSFVHSIYIYIRGCRKVSGEFVKECRDEDSHRGRRAWLLMHLMTTQTVQLMSSSF